MKFVRAVSFVTLLSVMSAVDVCGQSKPVQPVQGAMKASQAATGVHVQASQKPRRAAPSFASYCKAAVRTLAEYTRGWFHMPENSVVNINWGNVTRLCGGAVLDIDALARSDNIVVVKSAEQEETPSSVGTSRVGFGRNASHGKTVININPLQVGGQGGIPQGFVQAQPGYVPTQPGNVQTQPGFVQTQVPVFAPQYGPIPYPNARPNSPPPPGWKPDVLPPQGQQSPAGAPRPPAGAPQRSSMILAFPQAFQQAQSPPQSQSLYPPSYQPIYPNLHQPFPLNPAPAGPAATGSLSGSPNSSSSVIVISPSMMESRKYFYSTLASLDTYLESVHHLDEISRQLISLLDPNIMTELNKENSFYLQFPNIMTMVHQVIDLFGRFGNECRQAHVRLAQQQSVSAADALQVVKRCSYCATNQSVGACMTEDSICYSAMRQRVYVSGTFVTTCMKLPEVRAIAFGVQRKVVELGVNRVRNNDAYSPVHDALGGAL